jgi:hypothetical protein
MISTVARIEVPAKDAQSGVSRPVLMHCAQNAPLVRCAMTHRSPAGPLPGHDRTGAPGEYGIRY